MNSVYITAAGVFLPNKPISNEEMENYLGRIHGKDSVVRERILRQNGIQTRYYALDLKHQSTHQNAELAANAALKAIERSALKAQDVQLLACGTTQGDLPVPGFASMVHARLPLGAVELASFQSVCASGMMALKDAYHQIQCGVKSNALSIGSELASRLFKASRFEIQNIDRVSFDTEFLRWMLSDGAGAFVLENQLPEKGLALRIDWMDLESHAHQQPLCMFTGKNDGRNENEATWLDYPDYTAAANAGALNLKQDVRLLDDVVKIGVAHYFKLIDQGKINPNQIDWLCCHYSSEYFKGPILELMEKSGGLIPEERWFTNLHSKGNTGSASIYIMLEELMYSGKLKPGQRILCMVPESGRFITSFMQLTVLSADQENPVSVFGNDIEVPELLLPEGEVASWLVRNLAQVWLDFESGLYQVPIVRKILDERLSLNDYKLLLMDLRQQVVDGSQWISRAASNLDMPLFELRSAFIKHSAAEHRDYQLLEKNYELLGEDPEGIRNGQKNLGSIALSSFMFQQASKANPVDLLGSMFIIEGIGKQLAAKWGRLIQKQLKLSDDQVSFFTYHGTADENHFKNLEQALQHPMLDMEIAQRIVKTARTTALLYRLQLEQLGNY